MALRRALWIALVLAAALGVYFAATFSPVPVTPPLPVPDAAVTPPAPHVEVPSAPEERRPPEVKPSEAELLSQLRALVDAQPAAALALAEEARRQFPDGPTADERSLLEMQALVHVDRIADARVQATAFFQRYPGSPFAERVFRLTGMHPRPRPPVP